MIICTYVSDFHMLFPYVSHFCSVVKHYYKSIHLNCKWFVTQYIVEHSVLMSRILYFQLNRQYVSGRHVSLSVHSLYESLNGLCICTMATASPPHSIQKRPNLFGNTWATFMANNELKWWFCGGSLPNLLWCYRVQMLHAFTLSEACRSVVLLSIMIRLLAN